MVEFDRSAFIAKFQEEATDLLQRLNEGIINLEAEPTNRPLIDQWLRDAHTLKGSSRMVGLMEISDIAHRMEDVMVKVRDGDLAYTADMTDTFFEALDTVVFLAEHAGKDSAADADVEGVTGRLAVIAGSVVVPEQAEDGGSGAAAHDDARVPAADADPGSAEGSAVADDADAPITPDGGQAPQAAHRDERLQSKEQTTVRIRTSQVDRLLNLVSEVVISQIKAEQRVRDMRSASMRAAESLQIWGRIKTMLSALPHDAQTALDDDLHMLDEYMLGLRKDLVALAKDYADDTSRTSTVVGDLQGNAMALRMLPVSTVFNTFPRVMRDLAKQFKKDVDLVIEGGDTELDKKVLEDQEILRLVNETESKSKVMREDVRKAREADVRPAAGAECGGKGLAMVAHGALRKKAEQNARVHQGGHHLAAHLLLARLEVRDLIQHDIEEAARLAGVEGDGPSSAVSLSQDGRYVAFVSGLTLEELKEGELGREVAAAAGGALWPALSQRLAGRGDVEQPEEVLLPQEEERVPRDPVHGQGPRLDPSAQRLGVGIVVGHPVPGRPLDALELLQDGPRFADQLHSRPSWRRVFRRLRSILPLGFRGISSSRWNAVGTMYFGRNASRRRRNSDGSTSVLAS